MSILYVFCIREAKINRRYTQGRVDIQKIYKRSSLALGSIVLL